LKEITALHPTRLVFHGGQFYIADKWLEAHDDYYNHHIGMIIRVVGWNGDDRYYEIAGRARNKDGTDTYDGTNGGYWLVRIDPEEEFANVPVADFDTPDNPADDSEDGET
jgi:hypothetical protein